MFFVFTADVIRWLSNKSVQLEVKKFGNWLCYRYLPFPTSRCFQVPDEYSQKNIQIEEQVIRRTLDCTFLKDLRGQFIRCRILTKFCVFDCENLNFFIINSLFHAIFLYYKLLL